MQLDKLIQYVARLMHLLVWCPRGERDWRRSRFFLVTDTPSHSCTRLQRLLYLKLVQGLAQRPESQWCAAVGRRDGAGPRSRTDGWGWAWVHGGAPRAEWTELPTKMSKEVSQWCCWKRENEIPEKLMAQYSQSYCVFQARPPCALHKVTLLWIGKGVSQRPATLIKYFLLILPQYLCGRGTRFYV